jgi:hypothetical protein
MIYKYKIIYSNLNKSKMLDGGSNFSSSTTSSTSSTTSSFTNYLSNEKQIILEILELKIEVYKLKLRAVIGAVREPQEKDVEDNYERINRNRLNDEKFNIFFDIKNNFKYFQEENFYTVKIDFNDSNTYDDFFNNEKIKYQEIAFDYSTVKFFESVNDYFNLIKKLLNVLNNGGKLYIPIKTSHNRGSYINIDKNNQLINPMNKIRSEFQSTPFVIKFNELFNTLNTEDFILLNDGTFVLSEDKKLEIQLGGYRYSLEEIVITKDGINYYPNKDYFKDLFKERIINTIFDFNTKYEFINEPYPFEPSNFLKEKNYNEPYIVIKKYN